jgi:hypothetical protein
MKKHDMTREATILATRCIKRCNDLISVCQKLRDSGMTQDAALTTECVQRADECIVACSEWSAYCRKQQEECHDEDCRILYEDAFLKSDVCIKACGDVKKELMESHSIRNILDACINCVEACDECIEECAHRVKKHL